MNREGGDGFFEAGTPGRGTPPACCYNIWMCLSPKTGFTFTNNDGDFFYNGPQKPLGCYNCPTGICCLPCPVLKCPFPLSNIFPSVCSFLSTCCQLPYGICTGPGVVRCLSVLPMGCVFWQSFCQLVSCQTGKKNAQCYPICCIFNKELYNAYVYGSLVYTVNGLLASTLFGSQYNPYIPQAVLDSTESCCPMGLLGYELVYPNWVSCFCCYSRFSTAPRPGRDGVSYCYASKDTVPEVMWRGRRCGCDGGSDQPIADYGFWAWPKGTGRPDARGRPDHLPPLPGQRLGTWDQTHLPAQYGSPEAHTDKLIINYHGGAYILLGGIDQSIVATQLVQATGCVVLTPDYKRAPETQWGGSKALDTDVYNPQDDDSPLAVARYVLKEACYTWEGDKIVGKRYGPENVFVTGDSAGGNLTLSTLSSVGGIGSDDDKKLYPPIYCEDGTTPISVKLAGMALQSPWCDLRTGVSSHAPDATVEVGVDNPPSSTFFYDDRTFATTALGYDNSSMMDNNPENGINSSRQKMECDYLPVVGIAASAEIFRTGYPGSRLTGRYNRAPPYAALLKEKKTFLTKEQWYGQSKYQSPVLMTPEDAVQAMPKNVWLVTGLYEVLKSQQDHVATTFKAAGLMPTIGFDLNTPEDVPKDPKKSVGVQVVPPISHDWGVFGVPPDYAPLLATNISKGNFILGVLEKQKQEGNCN